MPTLVTFIANAIVLALGSATVTSAALVAFSVITANIIVAGLVIGAYALTRPRRPGQLSFAGTAQARTQMVRQAITTRKIIYGEIKVSGPLVLLETTGSNQFRHIVIPLCDQESNRIGTVFFNDTPIYEDQLDAGGNVISGRFSGVARIKKHLGASDQTADTDLVSEVEKWTTEHRGRGVTYLYVRVELNQTSFPTGLPNISAIVQGQKIFDPRSSVTRWSPNVAHCVRSYLLNPRYGRPSLTSAGIDDTSFNADANTCEEFVAAPIITHAVSSIDTGNDELTLNGTSLRFSFKNKVRLTTTGTLPTGLALNTDYYVIISSRVGRVVRLATSKQNANDGIFIDLADVGTGTHTVTLEGFHTVQSVVTATDVLELDEQKLSVQTGDKVNLATTGTLPAGLAPATDYYVIVHHEQEVLDDNDAVLERCAVQLASSYFNALDRVAIDITDVGTGTHTLIKKGEPRYTCNGLVDSGDDPHKILSEMLTAMSGTIIQIGGTWKSLAGVYRPPTLSLDEGDVVSSISTPTRVSEKSRFNRIRGTYVNPENDWQPSDYPPVTKTAYQTADNGVITDKDDFDLPFTSRSQTAQRLASIILNRMRQEITMEATFTTKAYLAQAGDTENISNTVRGWSNKVFEVVESTPGFVPDENEVPVWVVRQVLRETAASVYDFDPDVDEVIIDDAPNTNLPNAFAKDPPSNLMIDEEIYVTRDGAGVKVRAILSWDASPDQLVNEYQVEHKLPSDPTWIIQPTTRGLTYNIDDIDPTLWDFRVKGINSLGVSTAYVSKQQKIFGLLTPPTEPQNLTISVVGGTAYLRWDKSPDVDVRVGGEYIVRHSQKLTGASWTESVTIGPAIGGNETLAVLPLKEGTYMMKAKDASNPPVFSTGTASVTTKQASVSAFTTTDTLTEDPTFAGAKVSTQVVSNVLKLTTGGGGVDPSGTYTFSGAFDFGSVVSRRITTLIDALVVNVDDLIDDRLDLIDTWLDFDGTLQANADAVIFMRQTDDDPTGSPTFGPWERIESGEVEAWGVQFRVELTSDNSGFNMEISELSVKAESIV